MKIVIANDHAAVDMKMEIMTYLQELGHEVLNIGTDTAGSCGQAGKETVAQFSRRDMQYHKKPCNHADAGDQLDHSHSSSSFP